MYLYTFESIWLAVEKSLSTLQELGEGVRNSLAKVHLTLVHGFSVTLDNVLSKPLRRPCTTILELPKRARASPVSLQRDV